MKTINKFLILFLAIFFTASHVYSQGQEETRSAYVLPDFDNGTVYQGTTRYERFLNYNAFTQEMVFSVGLDHSILNGTGIDSVVINSRVFIAEGNVPGYYELATHTPIALCVRFKCTLELSSAKSAFGMDHAQDITAKNIAPDDKTRLYDLVAPTNFKTTMERSFFLRKSGKLIGVENLKQFQAIFPANADKIKDFVKTNRIKFSNTDDVKKLTIYCNNIM